MRGSQHRHLIRLLLVLAAVGLLAVVTAGAGDLLSLRIDKRHHGTRLTSAPRLSFVTGVLRQGRHGAWQLDDGTQLSVSSGLEWREEDGGKVGYPAAGRLVMITGQKLGGVMAVRQATLLSRERQVQMTMTRAATEPDQPEPNMPH